MKKKERKRERRREKERERKKLIEWFNFASKMFENFSIKKILTNGN